MRRHAELLGEWLGDEARGVVDFRKHVPWYTKGFSVGSELRRALATSSSLAELDEHSARLDHGPALARARGRARAAAPRPASGSSCRTAGLNDPYECAALDEDAEAAISGG